MIRFTCPTCKSVLRWPGTRAGEKIACPKCGQRLLVPNPVKPAASNKTVLAPLLPPSPPLASEGKSQTFLEIGKDVGVQRERINLRRRFSSCLPATAAGLFFLGCLGLAVWLFYRAKVAEAPRPEMMHYLPNYSQIIISIRPESLARSEAFQELLREKPDLHKFETEFEGGSGLPLAQVKHMMMAVRNKGGFIPFSGSADFAVVCQTKNPAKVADMFANMKDSNYHEEKVGKYTIYTKTQESFCLVQKDLVLFASTANIREILLREGPPELSSGLQTAIRCADFSKDVVIVAYLKDGLRKILSHWNIQSELQEIDDALMRADAAGAAEVTCGKVLERREIIRCKDAAAAKELWKLWTDPQLQHKWDDLYFGCERRHKLRGAEITTTSVIDVGSIRKAGQDRR